MKRKENLENWKVNKLAGTLLNLSIFLISLAVIFYFFIFDFRSFICRLDDSGLAFQVTGVGGIFLIAFSLFVMYSFGVIHELSHWLSAKIAGYKNKAIGLFGLGIGGLFVDPNLPPTDKFNFVLMASYGSVFPLAIGILLYFIAFHFALMTKIINNSVVILTPFTFWLQIFSVLFIFIGLILAMFNILPIINGNDAYQIVKTKFKNNKSSFAFMSIFSIVAIYLTSFIYALNFITISLFVISLIFMNGIMLILDKSLNAFDSSKDSKGWHFRKSGLMLYYKL